jgi:hypothetical protein
MKIVERYRQRAAECEKLADAAISEKQRQRIFKIARSWSGLADQRERMLKRWGNSERPKPR